MGALIILIQNLHFKLNTAEDLVELSVTTAKHLTHSRHLLKCWINFRT
jgi:hypothetical protein